MSAGEEGQPAEQQQPSAPTGFEVSDLKRLLAEGNSITLADGTQVQVRFSARTMVAIEDEYGSVDGYMDEMNKATGGRLYHHLAWCLGRVMGVSEDQALDMVDTERAMEYVKALAAALFQAIPKPDENSGNGKAARGGRSPGAAGSTGRSSSGTSTRTPSGT